MTQELLYVANNQCRSLSLPTLSRFVTYFESTYLSDSATFKLASWNHFDTTGPRTNNNVEGYHNKLKNHVI